jgi:hypothetical protein
LQIVWPGSKTFATQLHMIFAIVTAAASAFRHVIARTTP